MAGKRVQTWWCVGCQLWHQAEPILAAVKAEAEKLAGKRANERAEGRASMTTEIKPERLKWKDDCAHTRFGRYMLNKCRIRNGKKLETEYEVCLDSKVIGISDNKTNGKMIAQADFNHLNEKESP